MDTPNGPNQTRGLKTHDKLIDRTKWVKFSIHDNGIFKSSIMINFVVGFSNVEGAKHYEIYELKKQSGKLFVHRSSTIMPTRVGVCVVSLKEIKMK